MNSSVLPKWVELIPAFEAEPETLMVHGIPHSLRILGRLQISSFDSDWCSYSQNIGKLLIF